MMETNGLRHQFMMRKTNRKHVGWSVAVVVVFGIFEIDRGPVAEQQNASGNGPSAEEKGIDLPDTEEPSDPGRFPL